LDHLLSKVVVAQRFGVRVMPRNVSRSSHGPATYTLRFTFTPRAMPKGPGGFWQIAIDWLRANPKDGPRARLFYFWVRFQFGTNLPSSMAFSVVGPNKRSTFA